ncbi:MAG: thiamine pyrophosphate-binding protein [Desulfatibacillum sp.]|nr:thiamine pyrophosphate-binding protein [Desulfatibacillum sp.]
MRIVTGGELVTECLVDQGVRYVFSIIGGQMGTIYDAIGKNPHIDVITPRSETSTAIMACGYAVTTGQPAVSMCTVGAGVVYEVAGLLKAWLTYLPVISIAPQVQSYKMKPNQENLQACEQDELFAPITKFNAIIYHWERIPQLIHRAFREAATGIPGPVHLDIPVDVLFRHKILTSQRRRRMLVPPHQSRYIGPISGDESALEKAGETLKSAKNPLVIVGQGLGRPGRFPQVRERLDKLGIPFLGTRLSGGAFDAGDQFFAGDALGFANSEPGKKILAEADCLLVVGLDPDSLKILDRTNTVPVIQVETDPAAMLTGDQTIPVYADPVSALNSLESVLAQKKGRRPVAWKNKVLKAGDAIARDILQQAGPQLETAFNLLDGDSIKDAIFVADGGPASYVPAFLKTRKHAGLHVMDQEDMSGAGLPFAIGAALGNPGRSVVLICDKDSLFHHLRELQPAEDLGVGITILCVDEEPNQGNVANLEKVLEGLGCHVHRAGDKPGIANILRHKGQPGAVLV